jgi:hypothetical protein
MARTIWKRGLWISCQPVTGWQEIHAHADHGGRGNRQRQDHLPTMIRNQRPGPVTVAAT